MCDDFSNQYRVFCGAGQAVIGGLLTSMLLTLFVVPVAYSLLDDFSFAR